MVFFVKPSSDITLGLINKSNLEKEDFSFGEPRIFTQAEAISSSTTKKTGMRTQAFLAKETGIIKLQRGRQVLSCSALDVGLSLFHSLF